jgi:hypothetical protein
MRIDRPRALQFPAILAVPNEALTGISLESMQLMPGGTVAFFTCTVHFLPLRSGRLLAETSFCGESSCKRI